jgi:uncharacterized membrane protein
METNPPVPEGSWTSRLEVQFVNERLRKIVENTPIPRISRTQITCIAMICVIICSVTVAVTLARVPQATTEQSTETERVATLSAVLTTGFSHAWYANIKRA